MYKVSLKQLEKIANPFEQISYDYLTSPLTIEEIEKTLDSGRLKSLEHDSNRVLLIKNIVEKIVNFKEEKVHIDFDNMVNVESGWVASNVEYLAAAIYLSSQKSELFIEVTGKEEVLSKLFQLVPVEPKKLSLGSNGHEYKNNHFNWKEETVEELNDWQNPKWILKQSKLEILNNTPEKFWEDSEFVEKFFEELVIDYFNNHKNTDFNKILPVLMDLPISSKAEIQEHIFNLPTKTGNSSLFAKIWNHKSMTEQKQQYFATKIDGNILYHLLITPELNILRYAKSKISDAIKLTKNNIEAFYQCVGRTGENDKNKLNIEKYLPAKYFESKSNLYEFMSNVTEEKDVQILFRYEYIFKGWQDASEIQYLLEEDEINEGYSVPKSLKHLYKMLKPELKKNKYIVKDFIKATDGNLIDIVPVEINTDISLLEMAALKGYKANGFQTTYNFFRIENKEAMINFIKMNPDLINHKHLPKEWLDDVDVLKVAFSKIQWKLLPENLQQKILTDKEFAKEMVNTNKDIYIHLPMTLKIDKEIMVSFLKGNQIQNQSLGKHLNSDIKLALPQAVYFSRELLIELIKLDSVSTFNIPKNFYSEKKFMLDLFSIYDEKNQENEFKIMIQKLPEEIKEFLHANEIKANYKERLEEIFLHNDLEYQMESSEVKNNKPKKKI